VTLTPTSYKRTNFFDCEAKTHTCKETWTYRIDPGPIEGGRVAGEVEIAFCNGQFEGATYPFRDRYTAYQWKVLGDIADQIKQIKDGATPIPRSVFDKPLPVEVKTGFSTVEPDADEILRRLEPGATFAQFVREYGACAARYHITTNPCSLFCSHVAEAVESTSPLITIHMPNELGKADTVRFIVRHLLPIWLNRDGTTETVVVADEVRQKRPLHPWTTRTSYWGIGSSIAGAQVKNWAIVDPVIHSSGDLERALDWFKEVFACRLQPDSRIIVLSYDRESPIETYLSELRGGPGSRSISTKHYWY